MASPTPKDKKKKEDKEKKKWRGFNPVAKIFNRKDSRASDKEDDIEEGEESPNTLSLSKRKRNETVSTTHGTNTIKREGTGTNITTRERPHPLLRPRSVAALDVDSIDCEGNEIQKPKPKVKPQFGYRPEELAELFPEEPVPAILVACINVLNEDIRREGIFRIPGRMTSILEMKSSFEAGNGLNVEEPNTLDIAGLVAQFFRELPEPLLMYDLYYNWIEAVKKENEEKIRESVKEMLTKIPEANYNILKYFMEFLANVGKNSGANRMGPRNLALVFGASLLNPPAIDQYDLANIKLQCSVIEHMITGYAYLFEGAEDSNANGQKLREKQVATIPAGNPASNAAAPSTQTTAPSGENRRKGFMKRRSTFFSTGHGSSSSSRISDMIIPVARAYQKHSDQIETKDSPVSEEKKKRKTKKTRKHRKDSESDAESDAISQEKAPEDDSESIEKSIEQSAE